MQHLKYIVLMSIMMLLMLASCKKAIPLTPKIVPIWNRADTAVDNRNGVILTLNFNETLLQFEGTVENTNSTVATNARVEVHTFDPTGTAMFEYGPSTPTDIQPGANLNIVLPASTAGNFSTYTMHAEIGTTAGTGG